MFKTLPLLLCVTCACPASSIILNPSFEEGSSPWVRTAITGSRPWGRGSATPQEGDWYVFTIAEASIEQSFPSILGSDITEFSFWIDRADSSTVFVELLFSGGTSSAQFDITSVTSPGWGQYDVLSLVDDADSVTGIRLTKLGIGTTRLDNFQLAVVPEPKVGALLAGGLLVLLTKRGRTRRSTTRPTALASRGLTGGSDVVEVVKER